ncbi:ABC transporter substrate-binding protein, partial [Blastococcus sp. CT_GayMR20]|uniref:ABC transporter substrate-binding protein n=1 Tax=Blastococcus sp. CT_GayMR20 TaxID=2559609 RepID=UPI001FD82A0E
MSRSSRRFTSAIAAATVASMLAACGGSDDGGGGGGGEGGANEASDIGITEDSIKLGGHFPLTGPASPGYSEIPTGIQAYFDHVNENGGVNDRQIEWIFRDDAYNPTNTTQVVNQLVLEDEVFAIVGGLGTPTHSAVLDFLNSEGVPDLFVASGSVLWGEDPETNPYTFAWQTDYQSEGKILGQYIAEEFPDAKIGLFVQDDDLGEDGESGLRQSLDDQIIEVQRYTSGNTNVGPQIAALQAAGADLVIGFATPTYTALSQLTARQLGFDPQWVYANIGSDPTLVGAILARVSQGAVTDASSLEGAITTEYIPTVDQTDNPWVQTFSEIWEASGQEGEFSNYRMYGMTLGYLTVSALQAAGQNPTRDGIIEAIEAVGADFEGPWFAPLRYSEDSHMGISGMSISQIVGTGSEELAPLQVTDLGDADIEEADVQESTPP